MTRFALYHAPAPGGLAQAAAHWLGRDALSGQSFPQPLPALKALTTSARRYGFHATLKAPFRLAPGTDAAALIDALDQFTGRTAPVAFDGLSIASLDGFLALVPRGDTGPLNALAAQIVTGFDRFRAPLSAEDRARRRPETLSERQRHLLDQYGYPYVLDQFRFHMTLTDRLTPEQQATIQPLAEAHFAPHLPSPYRLDTLCLFTEGADGVFQLHHRVSLG